MYDVCLHCSDESKLRKTNITPSDQGVYTCFAENQGGTLKQQSRVTVYNGM